MLTLEKFDNWLFNDPATPCDEETKVFVVRDDAITLCEGAVPAVYAEVKPEFREVLRRVQWAIDCGFIEFDTSSPCVVRKRITPKRPR